MAPVVSLALALPPAAAGTLSGTVRGPDGEPVPGAVVSLVSTGVSTVEADAEGRFAAELPPDRYRVRAVPPDSSDPLAGAWAPGVIERCEGESFLVGEGTLDGADVQLSVGAIVRGTLRYPDGSPASGAELTAVTNLVHARSASADSDGTFVIGGIVPGSVSVAIVAEDVPVQFVGGVFSAVDVIPTGLSAGSDLDLGSVVLRPGVTVGGSVRAGGALVSSGAVHVYCGSALREVEVGPDGRYEAVGLPPGDATAWAVVEGHATTYYPDHDRPTEYVPLQDGDRFEEMDLDLGPEATLTGRLRADAALDWTAAGLSLINSTGTVGVGAIPEPDGRFRFAGLHGGSYTLRLVGAAAGAVDDLWRDEHGRERTIELGTGEDLDLGEIDALLGAAIRGVVTESGSGVPIAGATVVVESDASPDLRVTASDAQGAFRIGGLLSGAYRLTVTAERGCPTDDGWVTIYHPGVPNEAFSAPIVVGVGEEAIWDPELPPDDDHDGMDDTWERRERLDPERDDSGEDPDRDGYTNLDEYLLGTDPHDPDRGCGCASRPAPLGSALGLAPAALALARRRRASERGRAREAVAREDGPPEPQPQPPESAGGASGAEGDPGAEGLPVSAVSTSG